ncbi:MAG TPA: DUF1553 domain-containing protein [Humisphaera sp.]
MSRKPARIFGVVTAIAFALLGTARARGGTPGLPSDARVDFNRDVRPILSENCYFCHGQDPAHRKGDLRLDVRDDAVKAKAIVPGKPEASEVLKRLASHDADEVMPPPKSNRKVTPAQVETIRKWIGQGAAYSKHWAFEPPVKPAVPKVGRADWPKSDLDRFVLARLEAEGLSPSREAAPEKWLRRASFDLTGLPPAPAELDAFAADVRARGEAAYAAAADRLLASEHFGERQAIDWLDAARYADTHGFNNDSARTMWRWRDWVIDAFNANKPYDRFITEQLAGDLLPDATTETRLATGFGRNHVINSEGGIIEEEYRVEYVADRVRTTSMAWLGLTMECSRCHDHKFDPLTQKDYYRLFAFFNNVPELGEDGRVANAVPLMPAPTKEQAKRLAEQERELARLDAAIATARDGLKPTEVGTEALDAVANDAATTKVPKDPSLAINFESAAAKEKGWSFPGKPPQLADGVRGKAWVIDAAGPAAKLDPAAFSPGNQSGGTVAFWLNTDPAAPADAPLLSNLNHQGNPADAGYGKGTELRLVDGELEFRASDRFPAYAMRVRSSGAALAPGRWRHVAVTFTPPSPDLARTPASTVRMFVDGAELPTVVLNDGLGAGGPAVQPWLLAADNAKDSARWKGRLDEWRAYARPLSGDEVRAVFAADALPYAVARVRSGQATAAERDWVGDANLRLHNADRRKDRDDRDKLWADHLALKRDVPLTMVMADLPQPRRAAVLVRGAYDKPGDAVEPGVPEALLASWPAGAPKNRLGLAQWLTRPDHPLTARVVVNRYWAQLFGTGIVKTLEDFGVQGEYPTHPELLDLLARDFVDGGWDLKRLLRTMVLSATYRQDSAATPALIERDPENRLLARGPRVRLPAELVRDQALAASGLLKHRQGGPSVFPYQPAELYKGTVVGANYPGTQWKQSHGDDLYRRSLYTFWKRTVPHPAMLTFDAPDREFCTARRSRTNTPLQALTLMNETAMVEAARALGGRMLKEGGGDDAARAAFGFRLVTGRSPEPAEVAVLAKAWAAFRKDYAADAKAAEALLKVGESKPDEAVPAPEQAAAAMVASMLLNLDEAVTKD